MDVNVIKLDGKDYIIIDAIEIDNNRYFVMANELDKDDYCLRRVVVENGKEFLELLDNEEEVDKVLLAFNNKHVRKDDNNEE